MRSGSSVVADDGVSRGDARRLLTEEPAAVAPSAAKRSPARTLVWIAAAIALFAAGAATAQVAARLFARGETPTAGTVRFEIPLPEGASVAREKAIISVSADGRMLVFPAIGGGDSRARLWLHRMDSLETRPVTGTERTDGGAFWSPDGRFLIFGSGGKLRKIGIDGGPAQPICDSLGPGGGFFTADNRIVFAAAGTGGIQQCPAGGGTATPVTAFKPGTQEPARKPRGI